MEMVYFNVIQTEPWFCVKRSSKNRKKLKKSLTIIKFSFSGWTSKTFGVADSGERVGPEVEGSIGRDVDHDRPRHEAAQRKQEMKKKVVYSKWD